MNNPYANVFAYEYVNKFVLTNGVKCIRATLTHSQCLIVLTLANVQLLQIWAFQDYRAKAMASSSFWNREKVISLTRTLPPTLLTIWQRDGILTSYDKVDTTITNILQKNILSKSAIEGIRQAYHRRLVLHWCWCAKELGICRDIRRMIGEMVFACLHADMLTVQPRKVKTKYPCADE